MEIPNPYESPKDVGSEDRRSIAEWVQLTAWLLAAVLMFGFSATMFITGYRLRQGIIASGRSLDEVPPTMLGQHPAMGVVFFCFGLICLLYAFKANRWIEWSSRT